MEMTALVLAAVHRVTFESCNDLIGGVHIKARVAKTLEILGLHWHLVATWHYVGWRMQGKLKSTCQ